MCHVAASMGYGCGDFCFFEASIIKTKIHVDTDCRCVKFKILLQDDIATRFQYCHSYNHLIHKFMDTIEVEREVFDALIERVDFLHKTVKTLYDEIRDKKLSDWLNTKQTCDYLHISERKLRTMKERGKIGFSHIGRLSQFKGSDITRLIIKEEGAGQ